MACCAVFVCFLAMLVGCLLTLLQRRGMLVTGQAVPDLGIPTMSMSHDFRTGLVESVISLETPPGNLAVSSSGRIIFNFHPIHKQPSGYKFAEVMGDSWIPRLDLDKATREVLSLRIGSSGRLFLLDHAGHGVMHTPKLVIFELGSSAKEDRFQMAYSFPNEIAGFGSMLNDFNLSPDESMLYIADTSALAGTPALIACSMALLEKQSKDACRRYLDGHLSVMPETLSINVNGDSALLSVLSRIGVDSIALDRKSRWLYFGPLSSTALFRVPAALLATNASESEVAGAVERYAAKPISDGLSTDDAGNVLVTAFEHSALVAIKPDRSLKVIYRSKEHLQWPDGLSFGPDGWLYVTCSALHHVMRGRSIADYAPFHILRLRMETAAAPGRSVTLKRAPAASPLEAWIRLDALMGPQRDVGKKAKKDPSEDWKSESVCKSFLAGFCPYDKVCAKIHSEAIRERFDQHPEGAKDSETRVSFEKLALQDCEDVLRLAEEYSVERIRNEPRKVKLPSEVVHRIELLKKQSNEIHRRADMLDKEATAGGGYKNLSMTWFRAAKDKLDEAEELERVENKKQLDAIRPTVCEVCGAVYIDEIKYKAHFEFDVHEGYKQVRERHADLEAKHAKMEQAIKAKGKEPSKAPDRRRRGSEEARPRQRSRGEDTRGRAAMVSGRERSGGHPGYSGYRAVAAASG
ncbi:Xylt1 [Symbiodinium pilosum]|uniref:Xylt1 protein n=1 Tax=Symbiodinium pilosum TaxID=2952 RepID=A0A812V0A7_SYMPI|nr:Xylt1 [Symbiodinium pilosum]